MLGLTKSRTSPRVLERRWRAEIDDHVIALEWSPDDRFLAAASVSGPITILDAATGEALRTLAGHGFGTTDAEWSPNAPLLATAGQDRTVRLWDITSGEAQVVLDPGADWVECLNWSLKGDRLVTAAGKHLRVFSTEGTLLREFPAHPSTIQDARWRPDGKEIASTAYSLLQTWNPEAEEPTRQLEWKGSSLVIAWSPNGRYLATGDQDSTVHFWIMRTGRDLQMWGYPTKVRELSWDSTSRYLATGGSSTVTVWDCSGRGPEGTRPIQLERHEDYIRALAFQRTGSMLASGAEDEMVYVWTPGRGSKPRARATVYGSVSQLSWSFQDRFLAVGSAEGSVDVFVAPRT